MVMQSELSEYAHHLESLLDQVRSGVVGCTSELVSTLLKANDCIIGFIKKIRGEGEVDEDLKQTTLKELKSFSNPQSEPVDEEKKRTSATTGKNCKNSKKPKTNLSDHPSVSRRIFEAWQ